MIVPGTIGLVSAIIIGGVNAYENFKLKGRMSDNEKSIEAMRKTLSATNREIKDAQAEQAEALAVIKDAQAEQVEALAAVKNAQAEQAEALTTVSTNMTNLGDTIQRLNDTLSSFEVQDAPVVAEGTVVVTKVEPKGKAKAKAKAA